MIDVITPRWPENSRIRALCTTRDGGHSSGPYRGLNLATHVGDDDRQVRANRRELCSALQLPSEPRWLRQVHGSTLIAGEDVHDEPAADACYTTQPGIVCAIMTADCLPILLCDRRAIVVVAIHAGWRGLRDNIIGQTLHRLRHPDRQWQAWIGPGISANAYQVGAEVRDQFVAIDPSYGEFFLQRDGAYWADLGGLAERQLAAAGVMTIDRYLGCTAGEPARFYSYRRDGVCGRMASLIWLT
jgi:polyphenol oxidase